MSSLFKRSNGVFYVAFQDPSRLPARKTLSTGLRVKRDAAKVQLAFDAGFRLGTFDPFTDCPTTFLRGGDPASRRPDLSRLGAAADAFLATRGNLRPTTQERYYYIVSRFAVHAGRETHTKAVTTAQVQAWLDSTATKPVTVNNYRRALSTLFRWLESEGVRAGDPTKAVRLPRVEQRHARYLSPADVETLCAAIGEGATASKHAAKGTGRWLTPIVRANVYLGLRAGEIVNLRWEDVDLTRGTLTVRCTDDFTTKAGRDRTIPIPAPARAVIEALPRRSQYVFPSHAGKRLGRVYMSVRFRHFADIAGLPAFVNFHTTRHTAASWLAERGTSIEALRVYLGHSSVTVTQRYMHLAPDGLASQIARAYA